MRGVAGGLAPLALSLLVACRGSGPTSPSETAKPALLPLTLTTEHFVLHYNDASAALMPAYARALEESWARITSDLGRTVPRIEGFFHPDAQSFTAATGFQATGSVEGSVRLHIVAVPLAPEVAVHEFAHNVTLALNPAAPDNPIWLWESVAVYEAGQLVPPSSVPCLAEDFPSLAEVNRRDGPCSVYRVGFTIVEFVVESWGWDGLRALVAANGDVAQALGLPVQAFESRWREFVESRYLAQQP